MYHRHLTYKASNYSNRLLHFPFSFFFFFSFSFSLLFPFSSIEISFNLFFFIVDFSSIAPLPLPHLSPLPLPLSLSLPPSFLSFFPPSSSPSSLLFLLHPFSIILFYPSSRLLRLFSPRFSSFSSILFYTLRAFPLSPISFILLIGSHLILCKLDLFVFFFFFYDRRFDGRMIYPSLQEPFILAHKTEKL